MKMSSKVKMSAIGSDAAFMLERALEEMDDIFKAEDSPAPAFVRDFSSRGTPSNHGMAAVHPNLSSGKFKETEKILGLLEELEFVLSGHILDEQHQLSDQERHFIYDQCRRLPCVIEFVLDLSEDLQGSTISSPQDQYTIMRREKVAYANEIEKLHKDIAVMEKELESTKKKMVEFARKNEELIIRMTEQRLSQQQQQKYPHNKLLLLDDEKDFELEHLRNRIEALLDEQEKKMPGEIEGSSPDSVSMLKTRLREKASECNKLKLLIEDMKQQQESKESAVQKVQDEIKRLIEENEKLRSQLASSNRVQMNGSIARRSPDSVNSDTLPRSNGFAKGFLQVQSDKSSSEPNLNNADGRAPSVPSAAPVISMPADTDALYRPYKRVISDVPFAHWPAQQVQEWMRDEGLEDYVDACAKCVVRGDDLLKFTTADYEKELGITDPLQQKKLRYALTAVQSNASDYPGRLDHNWVARWMEDLGLPQYKQLFFEHKIDGRVLMNLTLDDMLHMKIYNVLHHVSLKRAIQFLRHQKCHPQYLREVANQTEDRCDHVMLWTNHRIVHWLRSVDLAEYAPNLRGSGVHGALMVLEPRFNADTLSNLLSIPNNKTLLRRHVATQFTTLLSEPCAKQKDMTAKTADFVPLSGSEKHKLRKKGISFGSLRRRKSETDLDGLICPLELDVSTMYSPPPSLDPDAFFDMSESASLSPSFNTDNNSESTNEMSGTPRYGDLPLEVDHATARLASDSR